jgi:polysaccharide export outer membrane protein
MASRHVIAGAVVFALSAALTGAQQTGLVIAARDELNVSVYNHPELSGKFLVDVDGTFLYPPTGRIQAAGLTQRAIEIEVTSQLGKNILRNPQVTVVHLPAATKKFTVSGQVQSQGTFTFGGEIRLLEALSRAGSIREDAGDDLLILRPRAETAATAAPGAPIEPEKITIDLYALMNGSMKENVALQDGDTILVLKAEPLYVTGYVNNEGAYPARRNMTVQQAVALAGGISVQGSRKRIEITRQVNGRKVTLKNVAYESELVKPGDTIKVGRSIVGG